MKRTAREVDRLCIYIPMVSATREHFYVEERGNAKLGMRKKCLQKNAERESKIDERECEGIQERAPISEDYFSL